MNASARAPKARRYVFLVTAAVLLVGCALAILATRSETVRLPDGRSITLERCVFKAGPVYYDRPSAFALLKRLRKLFPRAVRRRVSVLAPEFVVTPDFREEPMLSVFFSGHDPHSEWNSPGTRVVVTDDQGQVYDPTVNTTIGSAFEIFAFPRRTKQLRLRLMDGDSFLAEFTVPNPVGHQEYPQWKANPLPLTARTGPIEVTLQSFIADGQQQMTLCIFSVRDNGESSTSWHPTSYEIFDATGNHWRLYRAKEITSTNRYVVANEIFGALWPGEDAWKLRVEFEQSITKATHSVEFVAKPEQINNYRQVVERLRAGETELRRD